VARRDFPPELGEPQWRAVFERATVGISIIDPTGRFIASNRAYQEMTGYAADELREMTFLDLTHEDDRSASGELGAQMFRGSRTRATVDKRCRRKDGRVIWVRLSASSTPGADGSPAMVMAVVEDITDRKRAEDEVRLSEAYLADAQRISRTGSWVLNPFTGSLFWSREVYHICGFDPAEGPGTYQMIMDRIHPDDLERVDADIRRGIRDKRDFEGEHRFRLPDGSIIHLHYVGHPVLGPDGEVVKCIGTIADITARKRAEEELTASLTLSRALAARLLRAQDDERRRIARQLHETTAQELAALKLNLAALDRHGAVAGEKDRALLQESAALAAQAMEDIRTLSYLLHPPLLDEAGLDSALRWYLNGFSERSGIEVRLDVAPEFGRLPQDIETTLFRSVQESLINIHRHAKSATAGIRLRREGGQVVLEVQDKGRGIRRVTGAAEGVGIAGMRERIQQLGGRLEIESGAGGTTVRAVLPLPSETS
jgi:PAS domain S-box-containing protein